MKTKDVLKWMAMFLAVSLFVSCDNNDDNDEEEPTEILISQAQLNNATKMIDDFTGGSFPHGGPSGTTGDETLREVYASLSSLSGTIAPGTIVAKNTYAKDAGGNKTNLYASFVMVKREPGYDTAKKDWEYMVIPFDANNDYATNPYGMLPAVGAATRGTNVNNGGCVGCHANAGGSDFLYVND